MSIISVSFWHEDFCGINIDRQKLYPCKMRNTTSKLFSSLFYPLLFVAFLWAIKVFEVLSNTNLSWYGIYPRTVHGLIGVVTMPLLHADFDHLLSNTVPLLILGTIIFYFYRSIAFQVFFWVYIMT